MDVIWKLIIRRKGLLVLCHPVCESLLEVLSPVCRSQHWENHLPAPASFQGQPASAAARTAALRRRQADPIPVPGSARTPSAQHKYCIPCWLFWAAHEVHGNGKRPSPERCEPRRAALSLIFWNSSELSLSLWKKKNWMTVVIYRYRLRIF